VRIVLPRGAAQVRDLTKRVLTPERREAALRAGAVEAVSIIRGRARKGQGLDGAMAPYSIPYADKRQDAGLQVGHVDLTASGQMLNDLEVVEATAEIAKVGFRPGGFGTEFTERARITKGKKTGRVISLTVKKTARRLDSALKAKWNHARRPWFGLNAAEMKRVAAKVSQALRGWTR
jgi:hypothetical protein